MCSTDSFGHDIQKHITIIYLEFTELYNVYSVQFSIMKARNETLESVHSTYASEHILYFICPSTSQALNSIDCRDKGQSLLFAEGFFNPFKTNIQCVLLNILRKTSYGLLFRWTSSFN